MLVRSTIAVGRRWFASLVLIVAVCADQAGAGPVDGVCAALARQAERAEGIPLGLVEAVALAEFGALVGRRGHDPTLAVDGHLGPRQLLLRIQARGAAQGAGVAQPGPLQHRRRLHADQSRLSRPCFRLGGRGARARRQRRVRRAVSAAAARGDPVLVAGDRPLPLAKSRSAAKPIARRYSASGNSYAACAWPTMCRPAWSAGRVWRMPRRRPWHRPPARA